MKIKAYILNNLEGVLVLVILISVTLINYFLYSKVAFLNFYYLPIIVSGYFLGKRASILIAFFTVLMVWGYILANEQGFMGVKTKIDDQLNITVWGAFLILSGWLGSLSEKLKLELNQSNLLREDLEKERCLLKESNEQLIEYSKTLEEKVAERTRELERTAKTDPLTKLWNRRGMMELMEIEKAKIRRSKKPFSFIMADVDHFKNINDTFGHQVGDEILKQLAQVLKKVPRGQDVFARWGGEEFLGVLPETGLGGALNLAEKLRVHFESLNFTFKGQSVPTTMSFGVTTFQPGETLDQGIKRADDGLYEAKKSASNKCLAV